MTKKIKKKIAKLLCWVELKKKKRLLNQLMNI